MPDLPDFRDTSSDLFPEPGPQYDGKTIVDEYGVTYRCLLIDGLGWGWRAEPRR